MKERRKGAQGLIVRPYEHSSLTLKLSLDMAMKRSQVYVELIFL